VAKLHISSQFDSGSIEVLNLNDHCHIELKIRKDSAADFAQWFHFVLCGAMNLPIDLKLLNAGFCSYPDGWTDYKIAASYDKHSWFRIDTQFDGEILSAKITPGANCIYFAYFEPYSFERHMNMIGSFTLSPYVFVDRLGGTSQGRDITLLKVTNTENSMLEMQKKKVWLIARQHPGETMAEWFAEGFLEGLLKKNDPVSCTLLDQCIFYIVPNMNPDGTVLGNMRTNALGVDLNREWCSPTLERSPEVYWVREKIIQTGVDIFLDAHGDEGLPYNFVAGSQSNISHSHLQAELEATFKESWTSARAGFQDQYNYGTPQRGSVPLSVATNWIADHFGCLALTIEMPFKDNAIDPMPLRGWDGQRSKEFGASALLPIQSVCSKLFKF